MNQFKKAKLKLAETGLQSENIADLQTAGINQTTQDDLSQNNDESKKKSYDINSNCISEKDTHEPENQYEIEINQKITNPETSLINNIYDSTNAITEKQLSNNTYNSTSQLLNENNHNIYTNSIINNAQLTKNNDIYNNNYELPNNYDSQIISNNINELSYQNYKNEQITSVRTNKTTTKKSVPNIFSPKGEAKSMRKSLVLKPTSVKIAENYCAKNGGSFNELIQTLLDNFIDEYGL